MSKYVVTVDGVEYRAEIEELGVRLSLYSNYTVPPRTPLSGGPALNTAPSHVSSASAVKPAAAPSVAPAPVAASAPAAAPTSGDAITSPLPGSVLKVCVSQGQQVKRGDVLFVIESMKMENDVLAPRDGTVTSVSAAQGSAVNTGAPLCTIE